MTQVLDFISLVPWTMIAMIINLYLLYRIVRRFLFKPVQAIFKQRQQELDTIYSKANALEEKAQIAKDSYEKKLEDAAVESEQLLKQAKKTAQIEQKEMQKQAKEKAHHIIQKAQDNALQIEKNAAKQMQQDSSDMAIDIASILLEKEINKVDHERLIEQYLEQIQKEDAI